VESIENWNMEFLDCSEAEKKMEEFVCNALEGVELNEYRRING